MKRRLSIILVAMLALCVGLAGTAEAKSLYAPTHHSNSFQAFNITPLAGDITFQGTYILSYANTPAGVAVHNPSGYLFISEESSDIEIVDNNIIEDVVRSSDPFFSQNDTITVLMGETDNEGAQKAIDRYREVVGKAVDVKCAVASFPKDGKTQQKLMEIAKTRFNTKWKEILL